MLKCFCNVCKKEMAFAQVEAAGVVQREWANRYPGWAIATLTGGQDDTFCPDHLPFAPDYWLEKVDILQKMQSQERATLKNHCKQFFQLAYAGEPVHRDLKQVTTGPKK